jgi:hypothetical protein
VTPPAGPPPGTGNPPSAAPAPPAAALGRPPSPGELAWAELAKQLTPAASIARIDTATARAVTTVTVIGLLLTGLGALGADQFAADGGAATGLAVATALTAALAVACALTAQVLTISRHLNPADLLAVKAWYRRQFSVRAYATQAATVLLIAAALLAGATAATALLTATASSPGPAATTPSAKASAERLGFGQALAERLLKAGDERLGVRHFRAGTWQELPVIVPGSPDVGVH